MHRLLTAYGLSVFKIAQRGNQRDISLPVQYNQLRKARNTKYNHHIAFLVLLRRIGCLKGHSRSPSSCHLYADS